jgi:hypothetical protein
VKSENFVKNTEIAEKRLLLESGMCYNKRRMENTMYEFISDLDAYFCENYANYDKLCVLDGYRMPKMQATKTNEYGVEVGYTLPKTEMRLALQKNKEQLLAQWKERFVDPTFSFSFIPCKWTTRLSNFFSVHTFSKRMHVLLKNRGMDENVLPEGLQIDAEVWKGLMSGRFLPTKNLLFSLALCMHLSFDECKDLLWVCYEKWDFTEAKDVVISYLLQQKIYYADKVAAALAEYKITGLFL